MNNCEGNAAIKVAICDDNESICLEIENIVTRYAKENIEGIEVEVFNKGEDLCEYLNENNCFDLIFLDIEFGSHMNGAEVAEYIRKDLGNEIVQIVFVSSQQTYSMRLFDIRPLEFLVKPINENAVCNILGTAIKITTKGNLPLEFRSGKNVYKIPRKNILYFKSEGRKIKIILGKGMQEFYGRLNRVMKQLDDRDFMRIHKSYLVNSNYVAEYKYDCVKMVNEEVLRISQLNRKKIRKKLMRIKDV